MENKINLVELLKDCPKGMELDCTVYDNCTLEIVFDGYLYPIQIQTPVGLMNLTKYGGLYENTHSKCVIFPKGRTTWEGFVPPCKFKDGDVIACDCSDGNSQLFIFKEYDDNNDTVCYLFLDTDGVLDIDECAWRTDRLATEEEKQKLLQAIKNNGYKWNAETKTLEKLIEPKFKVGDKIKSIFNNTQYIITDLTNTHYTLVEVINKFKYIEPIIEDKNWELVPNKFDINTLAPFESRVLVRDSDCGEWRGAFWGYLREKRYMKYDTSRGVYRQCIPYNDDTKHLLGKTNSCDDYYKNWE